MSQVGYIQFLAVTSKAQIPLENVAITVTALDGTAVSYTHLTLPTMAVV